MSRLSDVEELRGLEFRNDRFRCRRLKGCKRPGGDEVLLCAVAVDGMPVDAACVPADAVLDGRVDERPKYVKQRLVRRHAWIIEQLHSLICSSGVVARVPHAGGTDAGVTLVRKLRAPITASCKRGDEEAVMFHWNAPVELRQLCTPCPR